MPFRFFIFSFRGCRVPLEACLDVEVNGLSGFLRVKKFTFLIISIMYHRSGTLGF